MSGDILYNLSMKYDFLGKRNRCAIFGTINEYEKELQKNRTSQFYEQIIIDYNCGEFWFSSEDSFEQYSYDVLCGLKQKFPYIKLVWVGTEDNNTRNYDEFKLVDYQGNMFISPYKLLVMQIVKECAIVAVNIFIANKQNASIAYEYATCLNRKLLNYLYFC